MEEIKPVSPNDLKLSKVTAIHPQMIRAVNTLLTRFNGHSLNLTQNEIMAKFLEFEPTLSEDIVYKNKWLDFESIYIREGWNVKYDQPGYNESYEANFTFSV